MNRQDAVAKDDLTYLHESALAHGLDCLLAPGDTLLVGEPGGSLGLCLAEGVPPETSQAAAAILDEQDIVRKILASEDLPVPESETCDFGDDTNEIALRAARIGYPAVLRAVWGTNLDYRTIEVMHADDLSHDVGVLRKRRGDRSTRVRPARRFMIERLVSHSTAHALVVAGRILSVTHERSQSARRSSSPVPAADLDPTLVELILRSAKVVPGLGLVTVQVAVDDPTSSLRGQTHAIVGLDMHPRLALHDAAVPGAGAKLADKLLGRQTAGWSMLSAERRVEALVRVRIGDLGDADTFRSEFAQQFSARGVGGTLNVGSAGSVEGEICGNPADIARLTEDVISGAVGNARPLYVEERSSAPGMT